MFVRYRCIRCACKGNRRTFHFEHIVVGDTMTLLLVMVKRLIVTLLGVVFVQLGVPELVTLTMLMIVLLVKVLLKLAVPEPFNTIVLVASAIDVVCYRCIWCACKINRRTFILNISSLVILIHLLLVMVKRLSLHYSVWCCTTWCARTRNTNHVDDCVAREGIAQTRSTGTVQYDGLDCCRH